MNRTGVIVGIAGLTCNDAAAMKADLEKRFPGVAFALVSDASSVAFEWDEPERTVRL